MQPPAVSLRTVPHPPEEPPGVRDVLYGFVVWPQNECVSRCIMAWGRLVLQ